MTQQAFPDSIYTIISVCLLFASIFSVLFVYQRTPSLYMLAYPRVSARRVASLDGGRCFKPIFTRSTGFRRIFVT